MKTRHLIYLALSAGCVLAMFLIGQASHQPSGASMSSDDEPVPPVVRVARDTTPTVVEPTEDWLNAAQSAARTDDPNYPGPPNEAPYLNADTPVDSPLLQR